MHRLCLFSCISIPVDICPAEFPKGTGLLSISCIYHWNSLCNTRQNAFTDKTNSRTRHSHSVTKLHVSQQSRQLSTYLHLNSTRHLYLISSEETSVFPGRVSLHRLNQFPEKSYRLFPVTSCQPITWAMEMQSFPASCTLPPCRLGVLVSLLFAYTRCDFLSLSFKKNLFFLLHLQEMTRGIKATRGFAYDLLFYGHRLSRSFIRLVFPKLTSVKE